MVPKRSSSVIFRKTAHKVHKFSNGMFVRYTGHHHGKDARHYMAKAPVVPGGTYTVAHSTEDGGQVWVFLQEFPGLRFHADGFVPTPHQAEDHWQLADFSVYATAEA